MANLTLSVVDVTRNDWTNWASNFATKSINTTDTLDPVGGNTACKLTGGATTEAQFIYVAQNAGLVAAPVTFSCYVKKKTCEYVAIQTANQAAHHSVWHLTDGALVYAGSWHAGHKAVDAGNGWWLLTVSDYASVGYAEIGLSNATADLSIDGTGLTIYVYNFKQYQALTTAWAAAIGGYSMANATVGTEPMAETAAGARTFAGKSCVLSPFDDQARTLRCTTAGLLALVSGMPSHTWIIRGGVLGTPGAAVPLVGIAGTGTYAIGFGTDKKIYATIGSTTITGGAVQGATLHWVAFVWDAAQGKGALYSITEAGVVTTEVAFASMTVGTVTPTAIVFTERCSASAGRYIYPAALSAAALSREVKRLVAL